MKPPIQRQMELFSAALEHSAGPERDAFLSNACAGDDSLLDCLRALLAGHNQVGSFLAPATDPLDPTVTHLLPATEKPGDKIGRYKLLQQIGEGGCGTVYMAEQEEPVRRRLALKVIRLGMDTKSVIARFEAERQALALMDHPNIAKVFDGGATESGRPYFVMELVRGIKITDYCDQAQLSTTERLRLFIQVCQAVQHAHQKGIIHRDIKPSNILVTVNDGVAVPKVIDFGIAKATDQRLTDKSYFTQFQAFIGTPAYTSPEQAEMSSLDIDTRSDIYSLGVLLYELLTGQTPFPSERLVKSGLDEMRRIIREEEPLRPSTRLTTLGLADATELSRKRQAKIPQLASAVQGDLDWIVMTALEKDRTRRYETANALAADLKRHLNNEPVVARPPSTAYKIQKAFRRNQLVFAAGTAVAIALVAGLCLAALGWWQTCAERDKALQARQEAQVSEQKAVEAGQRAQAGEQEARRSAALARRLAYLADMAQVHQAADLGSVARARSLLNRYRPKPGEEDIRGFEWRYLWTQARSDETARLGEYAGGFDGLALSPDGIYLASTAPGGVEIRSFKNRALILTLTNAAGPIQFSPDSQRLVTSQDRGLALWNTRTWQQEADLPGAKEPFAFAQKGEAIVALQDDHLALWSLPESRKIAELPGTVSFPFRRFSPSMAVSPDGNRVFLSDTNQIRVWNLRTQTELDAIRPATTRQLRFVSVSPEGLLAVADLATKVTLWDPEARQLLHTFENHRGAVLSAVFSPDGSYLATGGLDGIIFLYDTHSRELLRRFKGHKGGIVALQFSSDGRWLVSGSPAAEDRSVRLWEVAGPSWVEGPEAKATLGAASLRFIDSNRSVVGFLADGYVRIDVRTGAVRPLPIGPAPAANSSNTPVGFASISPDGSRAAVRSEDGRSLRIWNILASAEEAVLLTNSPGRIRAVEFSSDGKRLAVAEEGRKTRVWNTADWSHQVLEHSVSTNVQRLVFSLDGSRLAQADVRGRTREDVSERGGEVLDLASGKSLLSFQVIPNRGLAFSPDGKLLALGTWNDSIHLWNVDRGEKIGTLDGNLATVLALSFSPDGKTLASCDDSRGLKLWNVETQQEILTLAGFADNMRQVLFSSDGLYLATHSVDRRLQLWRAPSFEEIAATEAREQAESQQP